MTIHLFHVEGVGDVRFERSRRAKRINISIRPFKGVRVAVPLGTSFQRAREFAESKKRWIRKHLATLPQLEEEQKAFSGIFEGINRKDARIILVERLQELADKHGFNYNRVYVRNQKTRWGSCSHRNNISLNIKLVRLPAVLMDYILVHELVHTQIKNHGPRFYAELERIVGNWKPLEKRLRQYDAGLV